MLGTILLENNYLKVNFKYHSECYKTIKKITGVSFDQDSRNWIVPIRQAKTLLASKYFSCKNFFYDFSWTDLTQQLNHLEQLVKEAKLNLAKNPFSVNQRDIELLEPSIIFSINHSDDLVLITCSNNSRKSLKLLKDTPFCIKTRFKRKFLLSSELLNPLIKNLRDYNLSFAVQDQLAQQLLATNSIRQKYLEDNFLEQVKDYRVAKMFPILDFSNDFFSLLDCNADLKIKLNLKSKSKVISLDLAKVLELLVLANDLQIPIHLTKTSYDKIYGYINNFNLYNHNLLPDFVLLSNHNLSCWRTYTDSKHKKSLVLQLNKEEIKCMKAEEIKQLRKKFSLFFLEDNKWLVPPIKTIEFFLYINNSKFSFKDCPCTESADYLIKDSKSKNKLLERQLFYQTISDVKIEGYPESEKLYPHQRVAIRWMLDNEAGILGDDMGLGKTVSSLVAYDLCKKAKVVDLMLVLSPNSLVKNWMREQKTWISQYNFKTIPENKNERTKFLQYLFENRFESLDGIVINFELMRTESICSTLKSVVGNRQVFLIIDESQRVKNHASKTFLALKEFALMAKKRFLLSGTPTPKDISDIWSQMYLIDKGERFGTSFYAWLQTVAELGTKWSEYGVKKFIPSAVQEVTLRVQEVLLRRKKEEVLNLPEKVFLYRDVELSGEQKKRFEMIKNELKVQVGKLKDGSEKLKKIDSILEEYLRAVQVCSNPRLIDPTWSGQPAKFIELDEIVAEVCQEKQEKIVIWTNYLLNVEELVKRYQRFNAKPFSSLVSTEERQSIIKDFQSDKKDSCSVLVAIPAAGGVGITLTASQTAVYLDRTWNAEHWLQSIDRIHRIGQTGTVNIIVLNASKIDELIGYNLAKKRRQMEKLMTTDFTETDTFIMNEQYPTVEELLEALS